MEGSWGRGLGEWLAREESTRVLVGRGGPSWAVVGGAGRAEFGRALRRAFRGRGYAAEIGRFGLDFAFSVSGVGEVVSFAEVHNARSRAVVGRLGMRHVGRILRPGLIAGSPGVHEAAPFALYRIARPARGPRDAAPREAKGATRRGPPPAERRS